MSIAIIAKAKATRLPTTAISILDSAANPDLRGSKLRQHGISAPHRRKGYSKAVTVDGNPGFETFENEGKHGTLLDHGGEALFFYKSKRNNRTRPHFRNGPSALM